MKMGESCFQDRFEGQFSGENRSSRLRLPALRPKWMHHLTGWLPEVSRWPSLRPVSGCLPLNAGPGNFKGCFYYQDTQKLAPGELKSY